MAGARREALLQAAWRAAGNQGAFVQSGSGDTYTIVYSGRPSDGPGPDFRDAILRTPDGELLRGDIEVHLKAAGWRQHGHHHDRQYSGVIFHVVAEGARAAMTAAKVQVPLIVLSPAEAAASARPAYVDLLPEVSLSEAGDRRFMARSSGFQLALKTASPDDVLWEAVLDGLGYSRNRKGFRQLAARLPWSKLSEACGRRLIATPDLERLMLWAGSMAGLPAAGSPAADAAESMGPLQGPKPAWAPSVGRPQNHPGRRIAAAAHLAHRWLSEGGPARSLEVAVMSAGRSRQVDAALVISRSGAQNACVGPGRAGAIVVNAVLPCIHAISLVQERWHVAERCLALYRSHARIPENGVEREARSLLRRAGKPSTPGTAREQQGLLYVYRALTTR